METKSYTLDPAITRNVERQYQFDTRRAQEKERAKSQKMKRLHRDIDDTYSIGKSPKPNTEFHEKNIDARHGENWFFKLSEEKKKEYLAKHPHSKYAGKKEPVLHRAKRFVGLAELAVGETRVFSGASAKFRPAIDNFNWLLTQRTGVEKAASLKKATFR